MKKKFQSLGIVMWLHFPIEIYNTNHICNFKFSRNCFFLKKQVKKQTKLILVIYFNPMYIEYYVSTHYKYENY